MIDNTLRVSINADVRGLNAGLNKAQSRLKAFGSKLTSVGSQLQTRLALPLIAGGTAAIKMAASFDKSMTKIKTLVGVAAQDVNAMSEGVKQMASDAGVSSGEAAEALFFITSAGLRGADAMAVLESATKASALGLGETATVADLATSALNAYGVENLSAVGATDVLTAAVREGKLEASELSSVMGQVLPVASNMGVQFHEVGAAFAAMSRTGTNASQAATQLNAILTGIMKPTKDAEEAMLELGTSKEKLRKQIKEEGLLSVFNTLKVASEKNAQAFERVFGNVRALRGILDLTGASASVTNEIFGRMANTAGVTEEAFNQLQQSSEFRLRKGLRNLQNQFTDLGAVLMDSLMPIIQSVIGFATSLFTAFKNLDPVTQQLAIGMAAFAAVLPTILSLGGSLLGLFAALVSPIGLIAAGVAGIAYVIYKNWNEVLPVVVGLYNRFVDLYNSTEPLRQAVFGLKSAFGAVFIFIKSRIDQVINVFKTMWGLIKEFSEKGIEGSFGDVLEKGFQEGENISSKAAVDIATLFAENYKKAINSRLQYATVEGVQTSLSNAVSGTKSMLTGMFSGIGIKAPTVTGGTEPKKPDLNSIFGGAQMPNDPMKKFAQSNSWSKLNANITASSEKMKELTEERMQKLQEKATAISGAVSGAFNDMSRGLVNSLGLADTGFQGFVKGLISTITQLISMMLASAISQSIAGATASGTATGPAAIFTTPAFIATAVGGVLSAFAAIPKFANGGIVSGPTLGLMGEYAGARNNPEVIAPLDKLRGMIGQSGQNVNVGGEFRIQGQDLVVALQRAERNRKRIL